MKWCVIWRIPRTILTLQFRALTANLVVPPAEKLRLEGNIVSAFVKLMYAFLWQEAYIRHGLFSRAHQI